MVTAKAGALAGFRRDYHACLYRRADALFGLTDAVLCADGPVVSLPELSLMPEHRRGHGALYDGLASGRSTSAGCAGRWPRCRCPATRGTGSRSPSTSARGCAPTRPPAATGCSTTSTDAARGKRR